jgi:hypothetical protein
MPSTLARFVLLCSLIVTMPVLAATFLDYRGPDAGVLIYSSGSIELPMNVTFHFKRVALPDGQKASDWQGSIGCRCVGFVRAQISDADYTGHETGKVVARNLPPGRYEIYNFLISGYNGVSTVNTTSRKKFAIPFEIKAGEATYIGNFARANVATGKGPISYYVITDKSERDLPIAKARRADLPPIRNEVFDVTKLEHPALRTTEFESFAEKLKRMKEQLEQMKSEAAGEAGQAP